MKPLDPDILKYEQELQLVNRKRLLALEELICLEAEQLPKDYYLFFKSVWNNVLMKGLSLGDNWHLSIIADHLQALYEGSLGSNRLVINIPPRGLKTTLCSVVFPTWVWAVKPSTQFLTLSHSEDLATRDANHSRRIILDDWYQNRWPLQLHDDQNAKANYENSEGGFRVAKGMLTQVTGRGADIIIIDDPHSVNNAISEKERENAIVSYDQMISTRLNNWNTGLIILIMQRLHDKDLTARFLEVEENAVHLRIPMEYDGKPFVSPLGLTDPRTEIGQLLHPERIPQKVVDTMKKKLGSFGSSCQLQQSPVPAEGGIIKKKWWHKWSEPIVPRFEWTILSIDGAWGADSLGRNETYDPKKSQSAMTLFGSFDYNNRKCLMLVDSWADFTEFYETRDIIFEWVGKHKPTTILVENKQSGTAIIQSLRRMNIHPAWTNPTRDKISRLIATQPAFEDGSIFYLPTESNENTILQVCAFPKSIYSDLTDTVSQAVERFIKFALVTTEAEEAEEKFWEDFMDGDNVFTLQ